MCERCECCGCRRSQARCFDRAPRYVEYDDFEGYATWQRVVIGIAAIVAMLSVMLFFGRTAELAVLGPLAGESHMPTKWMFLGSVIVAALVWSLGPLETEPFQPFKPGQK